MITYIAFLRGINVGGQKKVPMQALKELCSSLGFADVQTYIQSGNIVFKSGLSNPNQVEVLLFEAIEKQFGFMVPVLVKTSTEVAVILEKNPFNDSVDLAENRVYFVLLKSVPEKGITSNFKSESFKNEEFFMTEQCVYLTCNIGYGKAKLNNNLIEKRLNVTATTRNYKTMNRLLEMGLAT